MQELSFSKRKFRFTDPSVHAKQSLEFKTREPGCVNILQLLQLKVGPVGRVFALISVHIYYIHSRIHRIDLHPLTDEMDIREHPATANTLPHFEGCPEQ